MTLSTKTEPQFLADMEASYAVSTKQPSVVWEDGDILLGLFQSVCTQVNFLQTQAISIILQARANTSVGTDLDSWMAQFDFPREQAVAATGTETFGRNSVSVSAVSVSAAVLTNGVYVGGAVVQTQDGTITYQVIPDATQPNYHSATNSYILPAGSLTMTATVRAVTAGSSSNVAATNLSQTGTNIAGIDYVTNLASIASGEDAETDDAYRARFVAYLTTLAKGTIGAILTAINSVQPGLTIVPLQYVNVQGMPTIGAFTIVVDDGSGAPSSDLIARVGAAVDATRAFGIRSFVMGPVLVTLAIVANVRPATGYTQAQAQTSAQAASVAYVNSLSEGVGLPVSTLIAQLSNAAGVASVSAGTVTINGSTADVTITAGQKLNTDAAHVTIGVY